MQLKGQVWDLSERLCGKLICRHSLQVKLLGLFEGQLEDPGDCETFSIPSEVSQDILTEGEVPTLRGVGHLRDYIEV